MLATFLAASMAAHAAVLVLLPGFVKEEAPPPVRMEVTLLNPEPLPMAPPEPESPLQAKRKPERQPRPQASASTLRAPQPEPQAPLLALSPAQAPAERAFTVPAPVPAEPPPASAAPKEQVASVAVVPPTFNAAYLRNPAPRYPLAARRAGEQGTVLLRVLVAPDGVPARVELEKTSGSAHLDSAALEAVKAWRFVPARRGADAVEAWVLVPIAFRLEGSS